MAVLVATAALEAWGGTVTAALLLVAAGAGLALFAQGARAAGSGR